MIHRKLSLFFSLSILVSGCVRVPDCDLAEMAVSARVDSAVSEAVEEAGFAVGEWPSRTWWEELGDPVLDGLIRQALKSSPNLLAAQARMKAAAQIALQKRAALFPEIDFTINNNWEHLAKDGFFRAFAPTIPAAVNDFNVDFTFNYEIDFWGKYRDLFKAALGDAAAAAAERMQAELILTTSIAYTYAELQFLLRERQIVLQRDLNREEISNIRAKRTEHALDTAIVHLQARSNQLNVQSSLLEIDPKIEEHIHRLKALSGLGQDAVLDIPLASLDGLQIALPENLSLDLISRRPDLIAQKARVESAAKLIDAAKTDFYPNVNLCAFIGLETVFWSKLFRKENYSGSFQPALNLPIFTAGRLRAQLREKVEEFNDAVYTYNNLILSAAQEVADNLTSLAFLQKEIEVRENSLRVVQRQEYLTKRRVDHALDDRISLLEAQNTVLETQLELETVEYDKKLAGILLIRSLGGGIHG